jgi:hypothetical protein
MAGSRIPRAAGGVLIAYHYTVAHMEYVGTRLHFGPPTPVETRGIVDANPVEATREIAYDPKDPSRSVMRPGVNSLAVGGAVGSFIILVLGITWLVSL